MDPLYKLITQKAVAEQQSTSNSFNNSRITPVMFSIDYSVGYEGYYLF
jgi:hypothetical protein